MLPSVAGVAVVVGGELALRLVPRGDFHRALIDVLPQNVLDLLLAGAVVVVDVYAAHAHLQVMFHPFSGIAVFHPSDGAECHVGLSESLGRRSPKFGVTVQPLRCLVAVAP